MLILHVFTSKIGEQYKRWTSQSTSINECFLPPHGIISNWYGLSSPFINVSSPSCERITLLRQLIERWLRLDIGQYQCVLWILVCFSLATIGFHWSIELHISFSQWKRFPNSVKLVVLASYRVIQPRESEIIGQRGNGDYRIFLPDGT